MTKYPQCAQVENRIYKINTDFSIALRCNEIAESDVSDNERALAILYLLFGDDALDNPRDWNKLMNIALKYLSCEKDTQEVEKNQQEEVNMDFQQDWNYIQASFFSDYHIDLSKTKMHWYQFYDLLCGLTENCIFNRVRFVRDFDISQIKDSKEKKKWKKQKEQVALKKKLHKEPYRKTSEEKRLDALFREQLKGG